MLNFAADALCEYCRPEAVEFPRQAPAAPEAQAAEALSFLEALRPGGPWVLSAIVPDGPIITQTIKTPAAAQQFIEIHHGRRNIYYSVNPTRTAMQKKAEKTDIAAVQYLLSDLDPNDDESSEAAKARYLQRLKTFTPTPSAIIDSGNGIQVLWRLLDWVALGEPIRQNGELCFSAADLARIEDIEGRIKQTMLQLGAKAGTQNIDRILRLPGTLNLPNAKKQGVGRAPCFAKLIECNGAAYALDDFEKPPASEDSNNSYSNRKRRPLTDVPGLSPETPIVNLADDRLQTLSSTVRFMIEHAAPPPNASEKVRRLTGGNGHCMVIGALVRQGFSNAQIKQIYRLGRIGTGPRNSPRGFDGYVERVIALCRGDAKAGALPELLLSKSDLTIAAKKLARYIAARSRFLFNGNEPIQVVQESGMMPKAISVTAEAVRVFAHEICSPVKLVDRMVVKTTLSRDVANLYLQGLEGAWGLKPFRGITTAPILSDDGALRTGSGYDNATGLWCHAVPEICIPQRPSKADAEAALRELRFFFRTFPFEDAKCERDLALGVNVIIPGEPIGLDESCFLAALMTSVCRACLPLAPGILANAPAYSGAGTGKGMLMRSICIIASGAQPSAFTSGHNDEEFDKRLTSALIDARPAIFLDNFNAKDLSSPTLASALTENPCETRPFGQTKMVKLYSNSLIAITGNAVAIAEDMARRLLEIKFDARMEHPELRPFKPGFLEAVYENRVALLSQALTIWRWGRQNYQCLEHGKALGSYEKWAQWCRDPLLNLGARDPVDRIEENKAADPKRKLIIEVFNAWDEKHKDFVLAKDLDPSVIELIDEKAATHGDGGFTYSRQKVAAWLRNHANARVGGRVLISKLAGREGKPTTLYKLESQ